MRDRLFYRRLRKETIRIPIPRTRTSMSQTRRTSPVNTTLAMKAKAHRAPPTSNERLEGVAACSEPGQEPRCLSVLTRLRPFSVTVHCAGSFYISNHFQSVIESVVRCSVFCPNWDPIFMSLPFFCWDLLCQVLNGVRSCKGCLTIDKPSHRQSWLRMLLFPSFPLIPVTQPELNTPRAKLTSVFQMASVHPSRKVRKSFLRT